MGTLTRDEKAERVYRDNTTLRYIEVFEQAARVEQGLLYFWETDWLRTSKLVPAGQLWTLAKPEDWDAVAAKKYLLVDWETHPRPRFRVRPLTTVGAPA